MLFLFRNNQVTTAFLLAIYVAILHTPAMLGWVTPPAGMASGHSLLFHNLFSRVLADPRLSAVVTTVLVFLQALLINRLADTFRLMNDRNWIPGALYALSASCLPDFLFLSPPLVAVTFVPLALRSIFMVYKQSMTFGAIFDAAFSITVGCLFHPPMAWLVPAAYMGFFSLRSFPPREQAVFFTGVFVPSFLATTAYFWFDQAGLFMQGQFGLGLAPGLGSFPAGLLGSLKAALLLVLLVTVLVGFNVYYYKKLIQVQKFITILFWFLFAGLLAALLHRDAGLQYGVLVMPSIAIFLSYSFQALRNTFMAEVFHFALFIAVFFIQFFPAASG